MLRTARDYSKNLPLDAEKPSKDGDIEGHDPYDQTDELFVTFVNEPGPEKSNEDGRDTKKTRQQEAPSLAMKPPTGRGVNGNNLGLLKAA